MDKISNVALIKFQEQYYSVFYVLDIKALQLRSSKTSWLYFIKGNINRNKLQTAFLKLK